MRFLVFFIILALLYSPAHADCTGPTAVAGTIDYAGSPDHVFKYCDGISWHAMSLPACSKGQGLMMKQGSWSCCPSPAGSVWEDIGPAPTVFFKTVYGNGVYVSTTESGPVWASTNGVDWTQTSSPNLYRYSLTYADGIFVGMSGFPVALATSTNGITWTNRTPLPIPNVGNVAYGNGRFVVASVNGNRSAYSLDGISWTTGGTLPASQVWYNLTFGNGLFVAVGGNRVATSPDGVIWTNHPLPSSSWDKIAYQNGIFVAAKWTTGGGPGIITSTDGINWTTPDTWPFRDGGWESLAGDSGLFAMSNHNDRILVSPDGMNWTERLFPPPIRSITSAHGKLFVTGSNLTISNPTPCP